MLARSSSEGLFVIDLRLFSFTDDANRQGLRLATKSYQFRREQRNGAISMERSLWGRRLFADAISLCDETLDPTNYAFTYRDMIVDSALRGSNFTHVSSAVHIYMIFIYSYSRIPLSSGISRTHNTKISIY